MPYIPVKDRMRALERPETVGELNYAITTLITDWLDDEPLSYKRLNGAFGALECAKLELYRRMVAPYEDRKCEENGDVYP